MNELVKAAKAWQKEMGKTNEEMGEILGVDRSTWCHFKKVGTMTSEHENALRELLFGGQDETLMAELLLDMERLLAHLRSDAPAQLKWLRVESTLASYVSARRLTASVPQKQPNK